MRRSVLPRLLVLSFSITSSAVAHDLWIAPASFRLHEDSAVDLDMFQGAHFEIESILSLAPVRITRFEAASPSGKELLALEPSRTMLLPADRGTFVIAMERAPATILMTPESFETYLEEEGHESILREHRAGGAASVPIREQFTRHVKTLVSRGEPGGDAYRRRFGLRLEIIPLRDPLRLSIGAELPLLVVFEGRPLPKARVTLYTRTPFGTVADSMRTDERGEGTLPVAHSGDQLVRVMHLRRRGEGYESFWAAMTFQVEQSDRVRTTVVHPSGQ